MLIGSLSGRSAALDSGQWAGRAVSVVAGQEGQGQVFGGGGTAAEGFFEGGVAAVEGVGGLLAVQNLLDGEDLEAWVGGAVGGFVESGLGGFTEHGFGGLLKAEKDADLGYFADEDTGEVT